MDPRLEVPVSQQLSLGSRLSLDLELSGGADVVERLYDPLGDRFNLLGKPFQSSVDWADVPVRYSSEPAPEEPDLAGSLWDSVKQQPFRPVDG